MFNIDLDTCLTPNYIKKIVFERDDNYLAAIDDARQCQASTSDLCELLWNTASLILRPDAIAGGQAVNILSSLRDLGFVPVATRPVWLTLGQVHELWRYQANVSTRERLRLLDLIMTSGYSLYILFRDVTKRQLAPATVHLTYLKGTAIVENRRKWHLRTMAGPKVGNILSYVHVSDDPADVLREMALLFPRHQRINLLKEAQQVVDRTEMVRSLLTDLQSDVPKGLLDCRSLTSCAADKQLNEQAWFRILNTEGLLLSDTEVQKRWSIIVSRGKTCKVFIDGNSYDGRTAMVPDDKEFSLPLDSHLVFSDLGPR